MNLEQYLNQGSDVKRSPNVGLNITDVQIWRIGLHYNVRVPALEARFQTNATYFVESNGRALWTMDGDGNKRRMSCFYLDFDPSALKSNSPFNPIK